ncbi:MAG: M20/M25/M40 family metallo-hydrolase, partial [Candidatus Pacebacteria bacterium]|nr:M20/M25/M40 family metallo-hydrolase [Candidatus Paceibacterota bacterium]
SVFIMEMKKYFRGMAKEQNGIFDNPRATLNVAQIAGGDAMNKVPSVCTLGFEMRLIDNRQREKIMQAIADIIKKNGFKAEVGIGISLPVTKCSDRKFISIVEGITKKTAVGVSYATEGSLLPNVNNFVILGPGSIKVAHRANERVSKSSLYKAVKVYGGLIDKFCV